MPSLHANTLANDDHVVTNCSTESTELTCSDHDEVVVVPHSFNLKTGRRQCRVDQRSVLQSSTRVQNKVVNLDLLRERCRMMACEYGLFLQRKSTTGVEGSMHPNLLIDRRTPSTRVCQWLRSLILVETLLEETHSAMVRIRMCQT